MSKTQYEVAVELDYDPALVKLILERYSFKNAGEFVDYLWDWEFLPETIQEKKLTPKMTGEEKGELPQDEQVDTENAGAAEPHSSTVQDEENEEESTEGATAAEPHKLTLREETLLLYRQSKCLQCKERNRQIVSLPCGHFNLCIHCAPLCRECPIKDCDKLIDHTIVTYLS